MTLVVIGASAANAARVIEAASARGLRAVIGTGARPSWVMVATASQRRDALARFGLPAFRVVEWPALDGETEIAPDVLARGVARMAEIGPYRPVASPAGVALTRWLMPWIMRTLDRAIGPEDPVEEAPASEAEARDARMLEKAAKLDDPDEARRRAERKARRAVERAEEKAAARQAAQAGREERRS